MSSFFVSSLAKGLEVLQAFTRERPELTLSEVAEIVDITPAAARRALLTLKELGFVTNHKRQFLLTPRVLRLSETFLSSVSMQEVLQQYLQELVETTGDSASVAILDGPDILYIASVPVRRSFQLTPTIGTRYPAYATSLGRAILSRSSPETMEKVLTASRPSALTANTITDSALLREAIARARTNGIAANDEELAYGVVSVAMPILDTAGTAIAAVNCSTSPARTDIETMLKTRADPLGHARDQISAALRQHPVLLHSIHGYGG